MKNILQVTWQGLEKPSKQNYLIFLKDSFIEEAWPPVSGGLGSPRIPRRNEKHPQISRQGLEEPSKQNYLIFLKDIALFY